MIFSDRDFRVRSFFSNASKAAIFVQFDGRVNLVQNDGYAICQDPSICEEFLVGQTVFLKNDQGDWKMSRDAFEKRIYRMCGSIQEF